MKNPLLTDVILSKKVILCYQKESIFIDKNTLRKHDFLKSKGCIDTHPTFLFYVFVDIAL